MSEMFKHERTGWNGLQLAPFSMAAVCVLGACVISSAVMAEDKYGIIGPESPFFETIIDGARQQANELGVRLIVDQIPHSAGADMELTSVENLIAQNVAGIAIMPIDDALVPIIAAKASQFGVPLVVLGDSTVQTSVPTVGTDAANIATALAELARAKRSSGEFVIVAGENDPPTKVQMDAIRKVMANGWQEVGDPVLSRSPAAAAVASLDSGKSFDAIISTGGWPSGISSSEQRALAANLAGDHKVIVSLVDPAELKSIQGPDFVVSEAPDQIGSKGIELLLKLKRGEPVPAFTPTGIRFPKTQPDAMPDMCEWCNCCLPTVPK